MADYSLLVFSLHWFKGMLHMLNFMLFVLYI